VQFGLRPRHERSARRGRRWSRPNSGDSILDVSEKQRREDEQWREEHHDE